MKKLLCCLLMGAISMVSFAAFSTLEDSPGSKIEIASPAYDQAIALLSIKELQVYLGRKLSLQDKVKWMLARKVISKLRIDDEEALRKSSRTKANMGFAFALAGLLLFPLLAIPGLIFSNQALAIERENPGILGDAKGMAKAGQIMSWITFGLIVLAFFLLLLYLAILIQWK